MNETGSSTLAARNRLHHREQRDVGRVRPVRRRSRRHHLHRILRGSRPGGADQARDADHRTLQLRAQPHHGAGRRPGPVAGGYARQAARRVHHRLGHPGLECADQADARSEPRRISRRRFGLRARRRRHPEPVEPAGPRRGRRLHLLSGPVGPRPPRALGARALRRQVLRRGVRRARRSRPRRSHGQRLRRPQGLGRRSSR